MLTVASVVETLELRLVVTSGLSPGALDWRSVAGALTPVSRFHLSPTIIAGLR